MLPLKDQPNSGRGSGAVSIPGVIDHDPFSGKTGTASVGTASEPGT